MRLRSNAALRGSVSVKKQVESISAEQSRAFQREATFSWGIPCLTCTSTPHGCGIQISSLLAICGVGFHLYHSFGHGKITPTLFQFVKICQSICSRVVSTCRENASAGLCSFPCFHLFGGEQGCSSWGQRSWVSTDDWRWKQMKTNPGVMTMMCAQAPPSAPTWQAWANPPGWSNSGEKKQLRWEKST